jgi:uncharacterized membrane protein YeaQ/YmgE (transglycosylase-associated protein family)
MNILVWIIFGALSGWIASIIMKTDWRQGTVADILLGIFGAIVGGFIMGLFGQTGVTGFNLYSLLVSVLGAVVLLFVGRMFYPRG